MALVHSYEDAFNWDDYVIPKTKRKKRKLESSPNDAPPEPAIVSAEPEPTKQLRKKKKKTVSAKSASEVESHKVPDSSVLENENTGEVGAPDEKGGTLESESGQQQDVNEPLTQKDDEEVQEAEKNEDSAETKQQSSRKMRHRNQLMQTVERQLTAITGKIGVGEDAQLVCQGKAARKVARILKQPIITDTTSRKERTVFVGNIPAHCATFKTIRDFFQHCGIMIEVRFVIREKATKSNKMCYCEFDTTESCAKACALNGTYLGGSPLRINMSMDMTERRQAVQNRVKNRNIADNLSNRQLTKPQRSLDYDQQTNNWGGGGTLHQANSGSGRGWSRAGGGHGFSRGGGGGGKWGANKHSNAYNSPRSSTSGGDGGARPRSRPNASPLSAFLSKYKT